jgi:four helix bundle protein
MRRAAVSVPSNIAEGKGRNSDRELLPFLRQARGSVYELQTQLTIAKDLDYMPGVQHAELRDRAARVGQMLNGMIRFLSCAAKPRPMA